MNEEKLRTLLPVGSVVMLRGAQHAMMIYGIAQIDPESKKVFDYICVLWPEGNAGKGTQFLFNHEDIDKVLFKGLNGLERDQFIDRLVEMSEAGELPE